MRLLEPLRREIPGLTVKAAMSHDLRRKHAPRRPLRVCMVAYTFYENDGRVMRYAEALAQEGAQVEAIVLRREHQEIEGTVNGVRLLRIQRREKNERGKFTYFFRILAFFFRSMVEITRRHLKAPYDLIHVHSVPDFEVFAAIVPKLTGSKLILDIHDIVPEFYAAKFGVEENSLVFKTLKILERVSASFADHVIIANALWLAKITTRSTSHDKCSSFINYPDVSIFHPGLRTRREDGTFIAIYPGTLNWHQGLDIAVRAVAIAKHHIPNLQFHIYGEGSAKAQIVALTKELDLGETVSMRAPLPLREIASVMANADLGVVPKRNDSFGGDAFSTKILEFMAAGVPVVASETRVDRHYFNDSQLRFFTAGNDQDLARAMIHAYRNRELSGQLTSRALEYVRENNWNKKKDDYLAVVARLVNEVE